MRAPVWLRTSGIVNGALITGAVLALVGGPAPRSDVSLRSGGDEVRDVEWARSWEGMLAAGRASLSTPDDVRGGLGARARARSAFLEALFRARDARSLDGVLAVTGEFAQLGDRDVVAHGLEMGRRLAGSDAASLERVRAFEDSPAVAALLARRPS
jgi:hypothetical protein